MNVKYKDGLYKFFYLPILFHETIPGHSLQIITYSSKNITKIDIGLELTPFGTASFAASIEGWGLYAEYLAKRLNCYRTNLDLVGHYSFLLLRASRLVVDTGIHGYGWSYDRSVSYLLKNTLFNKEGAKSEVKRYFTYPGQATSYYIGYLSITNALSKAEKKLGLLFNLKHFHEVVLESLKYGPLETMEEAVDDLIDYTLSCSNGDKQCRKEKYRHLNYLNITTIQTSSKSSSLNQLSLISSMAYQIFLFIVFTL
ncbi:unnamed protein product [Dimorphilus gyrociliatus]|uniref:Uncharacterized protein n=1 Tax=Dimorphilus gyrociliatus TaxID=2664684 RepID=A0A7I8W672_9ANNE|nr:unnamed protein product [Dimorphilus gyrociliatus]